MHSTPHYFWTRSSLYRQTQWKKITRGSQYWAHWMLQQHSTLMWWNMKKSMSKLCVCIYGVCSYVEHSFSQFIAHLCCRGRRCSIHADEIIFHQQFHWWPWGCRQCYSLCRLLPFMLRLCQLWLFLHSSLSGRERETWEGFFVWSHFPPPSAAAPWNYLPSYCHLAAASSWSSLPQPPPLLPPRLMSGYSSAFGVKYPLHLSDLHPFILAALAL